MVHYMEEFGWRPYILTVHGEGSLPVKLGEQQILRIDDLSQQAICRTVLFRRIQNRLPYRIKNSLASWYWQAWWQNPALVDALGKMDVVVASYGPPSALWLGRYFGRRYKRPWVADFSRIPAH